MKSYKPKGKGSIQSPLPGMSAKDFEKMCKSVDKAFSQITKTAGKTGSVSSSAVRGVAQVASSVAHQAQQAQAAKQAQRYQQIPNAPGQAAQAGHSGQVGVGRAYQQPVSTALVPKGNFKSPTGLTVSGTIMTVIGGVGAFSFGAAALFGAALSLEGLSMELASAGSAAAVVFGVLAALFAVLLLFGVRNLTTSSHLRSFQRVFGTREALSFDDIATQANISRGKAVARARKLLKRKLIPQGRIDDKVTTLMVTDNAYQQYCQLQQSQQRAQEEKRLADQTRAVQEAERRAYEQGLASRLSAAELAFIMKGRDYQEQLRQLDILIDDEVVSERIVSINELVGRILARAEEEPAIIAYIDRLTTYYLPTTVKLLTAYDSLEDQPVQGENISNSRREIEHTLEVLRGAFEKLLDDTYQDLSLDVSSDISVLHSILAREGLTEGPFDACKQ